MGQITLPPNSHVLLDTMCLIFPRRSHVLTNDPDWRRVKEIEVLVPDEVLAA